MWIKTVDGLIVNAAKLDCIYYDEENDETRGCVGDSWYILAPRDVRVEVCTALHKNAAIVSVG